MHKLLCSKFPLSLKEVFTTEIRKQAVPLKGFIWGSICNGKANTTGFGKLRTAVHIALNHTRNVNTIVSEYEYFYIITEAALLMFQQHYTESNLQNTTKLVNLRPGWHNAWLLAEVTCRTVDSNQSIEMNQYKIQELYSEVSGSAGRQLVLDAQAVLDSVDKQWEQLRQHNTAKATIAAEIILRTQMFDI